MFSWHGGRKVTPQSAVQKFPGSISGSGNDFYVWYFVMLYMCIYILAKRYIIYMKMCNSFCNFKSFRILNICTMCDQLSGYKDTDLASLNCLFMAIL